MPASKPPEGPWPELNRQRRAIVVVDVVESVRLIQADEFDTIDRWRRFVRLAQTALLPQHRGRLVKSLGDGMLLEFEQVRDAVQAALALLQAIQPFNDGRSAERAIGLRVGVHVADVLVDSLDIYGAGVNLAARVAGLAQPGEVVVSAAVRDEMVQGLDVEFEDLGDCFLKHLQTAVRAFRLSPARGAAAVPRAPDAPATRPTLLVMPLQRPGADAGTLTLGDVVTSDLIVQLGRCGLWNVISRLSTDALKGRTLAPADIVALTGADYIVAGSCVPAGSGLHITLTVADARQGEPLWHGEFRAAESALLLGDAECLAEATREIGRTIIGVELQRAAHLSLPTLQAYAILFRAVALLHRTAADAVVDAQQRLEYLIDRHPREPEPHAWAARSHVLRVAQHGSADPQQQAARARDHIRRALDIQPRHALAQAIEGLVRLFIERDLDGAAQSYQAAIDSNPNEPLAWLFMASVHAHRAQGALALDCVRRAAQLSPLDPQDHYYNGVTAWAQLAGGDYAQAELHALRAVQSNCTHRPTFQTLAQAQALQDKLPQARASAARLMALAPGFTVARYVASFPGGATPYAHKLGDALRAAGVPA